MLQECARVRVPRHCKAGAFKVLESLHMEIEWLLVCLWKVADQPL